MRAEIVEISKIDDHYDDWDLIGATGTLATDRVYGDFVSGWFYPDDSEIQYYFVEVKTKPIYDA